MEQNKVTTRPASVTGAVVARRAWRAVTAQKTKQKVPEGPKMWKKNWKQNRRTLVLFFSVCFCSFCDAIRVTVNVDAAADDDSNSKMNIFLYNPFYCSFDFRCIEHMQLSVFVRSQ